MLDLGCGEGRFSRILIDRGAKRVLGIDLCEPMIKAAQESATGKDRYWVGDAQDLIFIDDHSFDLAISYLNQCESARFPGKQRRSISRAEARRAIHRRQPAPDELS